MIKTTKLPYLDLNCAYKQKYKKLKKFKSSKFYKVDIKSLVTKQHIRKLE